eukprot:scaffold13748_cov73-Isochrysis_galbana.AAC.1
MCPCESPSGRCTRRIGAARRRPCSELTKRRFYFESGVAPAPILRRALPSKARYPLGALSARRNIFEARSPLGALFLGALP